VCVSSYSVMDFICVDTDGSVFLKLSC